jgi:hypothetical protein
VSAASLFAWSVLALAAGVGAGMAIKSRRAGSRLLPGGQRT